MLFRLKMCVKVYFAGYYYSRLDRNQLMFFPLDRQRQNTKKLKTKLLSFYQQQMVFSQIVLKKAKITILFCSKNPKNDNYFSY